MSLFLDALASRIGTLKKGGEKNIEAAMAFFLRQFREGKIGRWTLDDVDGAEARYLQAARFGSEGGQQLMAETSSIRGTGELELELASGVAPATAIETQGQATLTSQVTETVSRYLQQAAVERAEAEAGRNVSATQQRKTDHKLKQENRAAKLKAKGVDKWANASWNKGTGAGRGYARGHKRAPPKGRKK